ncbi:MAG TPA: helix-turn-helix transcriptional regulator [Frankiaceae bacterium]|nr:helix-turn-helix transcriptional regulator [Frankiaceae bacterium]
MKQTGNERAYEDLAHRRAFGDRVRELRKERGWTQEVLAEAAGMGRGYLAEIEGGRRAATIDTIHRIAIALGVTIADLFTS